MNIATVRHPEQAPHTPAGECAFCGLPSGAAGQTAGPLYCCHGCRFAAAIAAADGDEGQARWAMTRLGLAVFFAMNVMVFTMLLWSQPLEAGDRFASVWYELARWACLWFTLPVVLLLGGPLAEDAISELREFRPALSLLLCVGVAAALAYSLWSLWAGRGEVYFEVAATVLVAVTLGRWFEAQGKLKTTAALRGLKQLLPDQVRLVLASGEYLIAPAELAVGDVFRVLPGERIATDGQVVRHEAAVDEQAVTGESLPVLRRTGDRVISGALVLDGPLDIRATARIKEGTVALMIEAVAGATAARTRYERLAEQISRWFLPVVVLIAVVTFAIHSWLATPAAALLAGLAVLVIACPCALGLATPMALWAAVGRAAQAGVLIRNGDALAALARATTVCFDKTGTLTTGNAAVESVRYSTGADVQLTLSVARGLCQSSTHPLAAAIARHTQSRIAYSAAIHGALARPGRGIAAVSDDVETTAYLGSRRWMAECGQRLPAELLSPDDDTRDDVAAEVFVAWKGRVQARFAIRETVRPEAETSIALLRRLGLRCAMLSGDRPVRTALLARSLALDYQAALLPADKLTALAAFAAAGPVVMVGDGINDAPALAAADVGIALGSGADISRHAAQVCLLTSDLSRLPWLVQLARQTEHAIRWNLTWAFGYNLAGIALAATGRLHPIIAAIAMTVSSLLVVANSLALARFQPGGEPPEARE